MTIRAGAVETLQIISRELDARELGKMFWVEIFQNRKQERNR